MASTRASTGSPTRLASQAPSKCAPQRELCTCGRQVRRKRAGHRWVVAFRRISKGEWEPENTRSIKVFETLQCGVCACPCVAVGPEPCCQTGNLPHWSLDDAIHDTCYLLNLIAVTRHHAPCGQIGRCTTPHSLGPRGSRYNLVLAGKARHCMKYRIACRSRRRSALLCSRSIDGIYSCFFKP